MAHPLRVFRPEELGGASPAMTAGELIESYGRHCASEGVHGPVAAKERRRTLTNFAAFRLADGRTVGEISVADCKPWMLQDFIEAHPGWKSVSTRRGRANTVRACFQWAADQERIDRNPFKSVRYAEAERRPELPDATLKVIEGLANKPFERALRFLRLTGCRIGELSQATWADIDWGKATWTIARHKSRRYTRKAKVVALVPEAVALLRSIAAIGTAPAAAGVTDVAAAGVPALTGPIFLNSRNHPWTDALLGQQLRRMLQRHGIETPARLHGIRHRAITAALTNGGALKLVSEQAGHSSTAITEKYYWHRSDEQTDAIREAFAKGLPREGK